MVGVARNCEEQRGAVRSCQEHLGAARNKNKIHLGVVLEVARSGAARSCEEVPGACSWLGTVLFPSVVMAPLSQKSAFVFSVVECSVIVCDSVVATVR